MCNEYDSRMFDDYSKNFFHKYIVEWWIIVNDFTSATSDVNCIFSRIRKENICSVRYIKLKTDLVLLDQRWWLISRRDARVSFVGRRVVRVNALSNVQHNGVNTRKSLVKMKKKGENLWNTKINKDFHIVCTCHTDEIVYTFFFFSKHLFSRQIIPVRF